MEVSFSVDFLHGKRRPRLDPRTRRVYNPRENVDAEKRIAIAYEGASIRGHGKVVMAPDHAPVRVVLDFYKAEPKRRVGMLPFVVKPDIDNLQKTVLDALNGVAWPDDAQVVTIIANKRNRDGVRSDRMDVTVSWEE